MPATEQTWRDIKLLHVIFAASCAGMLGVTVWMFAADHNREWKEYQRTFRRVETGTTTNRLAAEQGREYERELARLAADLEAARLAVPPPNLIAQFEREVTNNGGDVSKIRARYEALQAADELDRAEARAKLIELLQGHVAQARFVEENLLTEKKFKAADFDVARSEYDRAVEHDVPAAELAESKAKVDKIRKEVEKFDLAMQDAKTNRQQLEGILAEITAKEDAAKKALDERQIEVKRLLTAHSEQEIDPLENVLTLPILDAFGRPLKVDQIWLPKLTINNNFRDVARFDRCTTCHQGIDKTLKGSAVAPSYPLQQRLPEPLLLATPAKAPPRVAAERLDQQMLDVYGLRLAERGLIEQDDVTVAVVRPGSPAARALLQPGDVIERIGDAPALDRGMAVSKLLDTVDWGQPLKLTVRRGLPNPYASHPRLDLFVGSMSPHKMGDVGCTICHEGQGSGTDFKWASHTPNTPAQAAEWQREHGWFNNHHWIFPMMPKRFIESTCLKCHHDLFELEPNDRFPDPPAPKLLAGYNVIRTYGCFGCHEINGYDGPNRRLGPDVRLEPNYAPAAEALLASGGLTPQETALAEKLVFAPEENSVRRKLIDSLGQPEAVKSAGLDPQQAEKTSKARSADEFVRLVGMLADVETPGKFRRVGPSLRHVASKVDFGFLYSWIRNPRDFRDKTRMPRFFGLHEHLEGDGLKAAQRYEPLEIRGVTEYLLAKSQPFEYADPADDVAPPSAERGKTLFRDRGCLACHQHKDFPAGKAVQGPDLSNVGAKLDRLGKQERGRWLYTWLKNPTLYHPRTIMPNMLLDPVEVKLDPTKEELTRIDPAADVTMYLLDSMGWEPKDIPDAKQLTAEERKALYELALEGLKAVFPVKQAEKFLKEGIPASRRNGLKGDEVELLVEGKASPETMVAKQLQYVGRRTIARYGCNGCHDVPGFEDFKPIGTGLADWGRKTPDRLAFEQIAAYIERGHGAEPHGGEHSDASAAKPSDADTEFFHQALLGHERIGFLWQKLREPRSYDYKKTENKPYNDRLRMPQFNLTDEQREAVMTFVLGLVAEPPALQYVYQTSPRRRTIVEGQRLIDKFNCGGCHIFRLERWQIAFDPGSLDEPKAAVDYPFLVPSFTPKQIAASEKTNLEGKLEGTLVGLPALNNQTGLPIRFDSEGDEIEPDNTEAKTAAERAVLWEDVVLGGKAYRAGIDALNVPLASVVKHYPPQGGDLARWILPDVVADEKQVNAQANASEAWGWLPPPLVGEGNKVQTSWLYSFLMDPHPIRPATVTRMPNFNVSSAEATALVNFFAAVDNAQWPYEFDPRTQEEYLAAEEAHRPGRLNDALKLITSGDYCVQCHLVGDYIPQKADRGKGPQLAEVSRRMRPDYLLRWLARPTYYLPYTGMPVNFPHNPAKGEEKGQDLFKGTHEEQLRAVVDFLLNYDRQAQERFSIKPLVKPATMPPAGQPAAGEGNSAEK